jgi:hypothetical protein
VGWISLDDIKFQSKKTATPETRRDSTHESTIGDTANTSCSQAKDFHMKLSRRYLDWNRLSFDYHATGSQNIFDTARGQEVTKEITDSRKALNLTSVYGCAPQTYCLSCKPFGDQGNAYTLVQTAAAATVLNPDRSKKPRMIIINQGALRYDVVQGPFTVDDSYIVCPYKNTFKYFPDVPYSVASKVIDTLNKAKKPKRSLMAVDTISSQMLAYDECDNLSPHNGANLSKRKSLFRRVLGGTTPTPGYTTCDDLGNDGDDTPHSEIPEYPQPAHIQATAGFPSHGKPDMVDIVFSDFLDKRIAGALNSEHPSKNYTTDDTRLYMPVDFTTNNLIPAYASVAWKDHINNCSIAG